MPDFRVPLLASPPVWNNLMNVVDDPRIGLVILIGSMLLCTFLWLGKRPHVRGHLPAVPRRARLVRLVAVTAADFQLDVAAIPFAADVGRVRRLDLLHGVAALLVHGIDSRPGRDA